MNIEFGSAELNRFLDWTLKNVKLDPDGRGYWLYYISGPFERSLGARPCSVKDLVEVFRKSEHESSRWPSLSSAKKRLFPWGTVIAVIAITTFFIYLIYNGFQSC